MTNIWKFIATTCGIESEAAGVSLVEYGLIVGLIALAVLSAMSLVGSNVDGALSMIASYLPGFH